MNQFTQTGEKQYPIVVVGGGIVGLSFAALMAQAGIQVALIEACEPSLNAFNSKWDARVSAINIASMQLFSELGVWGHLKASAAGLDKMKIWDGISGARFDFDSADVGCAYLGYILENRVMLKALWELVKTKVDVYCPEKIESLVFSETSAQLVLHHHQKLSADLVVAADGAHSWVRKNATIALRERDYKQDAIVAVVQCEQSHQNMAWQCFLSTGPLALLPLVDPHHCAIVWSNDNAQASTLMQLSDTDFNRSLSNASELCLGALTVVTERQAIPLRMQQAEHYVKPRLALLGDAAHTLHPLAGQGVNFGLMDAECLAKIMIEAQLQGRDMGSYKNLRRYERARKSENEMIIQMVGAFKSLFALDQPAWVQARALGMQGLNQFTGLKKIMAQYAMGAGDLL